VAGGGGGWQRWGWRVAGGGGGWQRRVAGAGATAAVTAHPSLYMCESVNFCSILSCQDVLEHKVTKVRMNEDR
jgi:hypothetical protein